MTNEILLTHIGYLYNQHKKYAIKIKSKLNIGNSCNKEEINLKNSFYIIKELENYYNNCSCLKDENLCNLITVAKKILI